MVATYADNTSDSSGKPEPFYPDEVFEYLRIFAERNALPGESEIARKAKAVEEHAATVKEIQAIFQGQLKAKSSNSSPNTDEATYGWLHPISIVRRMIEKRGFATNDVESLTEIVRKSYPLDKQTNFYSKKAMPVLLGLAHLQAKNTDMPVTLVEADFSNMGGANERLGRDDTDKLLREMSDKAKHAFEGEGVEVQCIRAGGDELRVIVFGRELAEVENILRDTLHPQINLTAAKYGVHDVPHTKKGKLPGFGVAFGAVALGDDASVTTMRDTLNRKIEAQKLEDGLLRLGVVDEEGVERFMRQIYRPYLRETMRPGDIERKIRAEMPDNLKDAATLSERWHELAATSAPYRTELESLPLQGREEAIANPRVLFAGVAQNFKAARDILSAAPAIADKGGAAEPFPDQVILATAEESAVEQRLRKSLNQLGFTDIAQSPEKLFTFDPVGRKYILNRSAEHAPLTPSDGRKLRMTLDLGEWLDPPDPVTRCKTTHFLVNDAGGLIDKEGGSRVMVLELANVNGLNAVNYDLADAALRETGTIVKEALETQGMSPALASDRVYSKGGGLFIVPMPASWAKEKMDAVASYVDTQVAERIGAKSISAFALSTYARPRHEFDRESQEKIAALAQRIDEKWHAVPGTMKMSDIPHPKNAGKLLAVNIYDETVEKGADVGAFMDGIIKRAEAAFASLPSTVVKGRAR